MVALPTQPVPLSAAQAAQFSRAGQSSVSALLPNQPLPMSAAASRPPAAVMAVSASGPTPLQAPFLTSVPAAAAAAQQNIVTVTSAPPRLPQHPLPPTAAPSGVVKQEEQQPVPPPPRNVALKKRHMMAAQPVKEEKKDEVTVETVKAFKPRHRLTLDITANQQPSMEVKEEKGFAPSGATAPQASPAAAGSSADCA